MTATTYGNPFKFDLQLFAEEPEPEPDPEPEPEPVPANEPEPDDKEYEFDVDGEKKKVSKDVFNEVLNATLNAEAWEKKYHDKGRKLNQWQTDLGVKEKELAGDKDTLTEWKAVKKKLDANPETRKIIADALNQAKPSIDPVIQEVKKENEELRKDIDRDRAINKMGKEFDDFDHDDLLEFQKDFNFGDMGDMMKFTYLAKKGSELDDHIQTAKVEMVKEMKKKKGLPPTGKKFVPAVEPAASMDEARQKLHDLIRQGGSLT